MNPLMDASLDHREQGWSPGRLAGTPSRLQYTADLRQFRVLPGCISSRRHFKTSPSTSHQVRVRPPVAPETPVLGRWGGGARPLDAMNTAHAAVTWLSTVGIGSIRVPRFARGWRPCNG